VTALIGPSLLESLANGTAPEFLGNRSAEQPATRTASIAAATDRKTDGGGSLVCDLCVHRGEWTRLVGSWAGRPGPAPEFSDLARRLAHQDELDARVGTWTREHEAEELMEILQTAGIAAGIAANARDLCVRDPHLRARGYWTKITDPQGESATFDGVPVRLSSTPGFVGSPGPLLGEHTSRVLRNILGLDQTVIDELRRKGP
jgi:crotonobetainyl-CoA:carnitine CoA-transferase CaiB-like acyl-CoA transferase